MSRDSGAHLSIQATNRTSEFLSAVESQRLKSASLAPESKQRLLQGKDATSSGSQRSEFARHALSISKDLQSTTAKLEKLALLAKRKTLFDDRPVEVSELTYIIKRDIASLNSQIGQLQSLRAPGQGKRPLEEHNNNVVMMLQGRLANASIGFKDVLEIRTQNMKASRERGQVFGGESSAPNGSHGPASELRARKSISDSPLYMNHQAASSTSTRNRVQPDTKGKGKENDFLALDMGSSNLEAGRQGQEGGGFQQMQLVEQEDNYLASRSTAIESIEGTIAELGQIFSQLATMVAQQGETVQRIDADTSDIANNVGGAQRELLRYYTNISGNRAMMLKVFGVMIIFFLLFVLVT